MGLINNIKSMFSIGNTVEPATREEPQLSEKSLSDFGIDVTPARFAGVTVNTDSAAKLDTVYSCVRDKAESIGQLPVQLKRISTGEIITTGRNARIFTERPCEFLSMQDFIEMYVASMELRGAFYALPVRNRYGNVSQIIPFRNQMNVVPAMDTNGRVYYTYATNDGRPGMVFADGDILALKLTTLDGIHPLSPIKQMAQAIGVAISQENHISELMANGALQKGHLTTDQVFKDENAFKRLKQEWQDTYGGTKNSGKTPILEAGMEYKSMGISPADTELIKQRQFSVERICGAFRVPPSRIGMSEGSGGSRSRYTLEENNRSYLRDSLMPLITRFERGIKRFLPEGFELKIDERQFVRGDRKSQVESLKAEFSMGSISINEARVELGRTPAEGGDVHAIDTNNFTFGSLTDIPALQEMAREQTGVDKPSQSQTEGEDDDNSE